MCTCLRPAQGKARKKSQLASRKPPSFVVTSSYLGFCFCKMCFRSQTLLSWLCWEHDSIGIAGCNKYSRVQCIHNLPDCSSLGRITQLGPYSKNAGLTESFEDSSKCFLSLNLGDSGNRMPWDKTITRIRASSLNVQPTLLLRAPVWTDTMLNLMLHCGCLDILNNF